VATAAIDVSDGLLGDLQHVLDASRLGAVIDTSIAINLIAACARIPCATGLFPYEKQLQYVLAGGDDYELAFTASVVARDAVQAASALAATPVTRIGRMEASPGLRLVDAEGRAVPHAFASFDHFA
jgi:thiamine-monophosphate kinase